MGEITEDIQKAYEYIKKLANDKFFGKVEINMEGGKIVNIKQSKTIKIHEL